MPISITPPPNLTPQIPQQPDFLQKAGQAAQLKNMLSEAALRQQLAPLNVQEAQQRVQGQQTTNAMEALKLKTAQAENEYWSHPEKYSVDPEDASGDHNKMAGMLGLDSSDPVAGMMRGMMKAGVPGPIALHYGQSSMEFRKTANQASQEQQKLLDDAWTHVQKIAAPIMAEKDPGKKAQLLEEARPGLAKWATFDPSLQPIIPQLTAQNFDAFVNRIGAQKEAHEYAETVAKATKAGQQVAGGPLQPVEEAELTDFLKNPPKGYPATPVGFAKWKASLAPQAQINVQSGMLNDAALDQSAQRYLQTGQLPAGMRSPAMSAKIINRAGELGAGQSISANSAAYKANEDSYKNATKTLDTLTAFENVGKKNLENFLNLAKDIPDTGVPWINKPVRSLSKDLVGSDKMPAIDAARTVALREIARITNDPKLSGVLSDSARGEVEGLIPNNATLPQIRAVAKVLLQDVENVHSSVAAQKADIGARLGLEKPQQQNSGGLKVGQMVSIKGKQKKVTAIHSDGSFDAE